MKLALGTLALLGLAGIAAAQSTTSLTEDFENGMPAGWSASYTIPIYAQWRVTLNGECGSVTQMLAYNNSSSCAYFAVPWGTGGYLVTTPFTLVGPPPYGVSFDYVLGIDNDLDSTTVYLLPPASSGLNPVVVGTDDDLIADGQLHSVELVVPGSGAFVGMQVQLAFEFNGDASGNAGVGWLIDDLAVATAPPGTPYCFGDVSVCPCANGGGPDEGCAHSMGTVGAILDSTAGTASIAADDLVLSATQLPPAQFGIVFVGDSATSAPLFDGLLCVGGNTARYPPQNSGGSGPTDGVITQAGLVAGSAGLISAPGQTWRFQCWYRNVPASFSSCGGGANFSNALTVTYAP